MPIKTVRPTSMITNAFNQSASTEGFEVTRTRVEFPSDIKFAFKSINGDLIFGADNLRSIFFLKDGSKEAHELNTGRLDTNSKYNYVRFDIKDEIDSTKRIAEFKYVSEEGAVLRDNDENTLRFRAYNTAEIEALRNDVFDNKIKCFSLPEVREIQYAFRTAEGENILVSWDILKPTSKGMTLFLGQAGALEEIAITNAVSYGAGAMIIYTDKGELYTTSDDVPALNVRGDKPRWQDQPVTPVAPAEAEKIAGDTLKIRGVKKMAL